MSVLRVYGSLGDTTLQCAWSLRDGNRITEGNGSLDELPSHARQVEFIVPATDVLITSATLPRSAKRRTGMTLAYAVEEQSADEPDANQVFWLGRAGEEDVLAVVNRAGLARWLAAFDRFGMQAVDVRCESLLLPRKAGCWSVAWNGNEGYVRTSDVEALATDSGDHATPPLALRLALRNAAARKCVPESISVCAPSRDSAPDVQAWQRVLEVPVHAADSHDWRTAPADAGPVLMRAGSHWTTMAAVAARLRPAAVIAVCALLFHGLASVTDWAMLTREQDGLRQSMEVRFRTAFPEAVAVVDPALQMRRKLAEARHASGIEDEGDFLPVLDKAGSALRELAPGSLRMLSYDGGRLTLEVSGLDAAAAARVRKRLVESGLILETGAPPRSSDASGTAPAPGAATLFTVRAP